MKKIDQKQFSSAEELKEILEKFNKALGYDYTSPMTGVINLCYRIGPYIRHGSFGLFVGESIQEKLDQFIHRVFDASKRCCITLADSPDKELLAEYQDIAKNYSSKDVVLVDWEFTKKED